MRFLVKSRGISPDGWHRGDAIQLPQQECAPMAEDAAQAFQIAREKVLALLSTGLDDDCPLDHIGDVLANLRFTVGDLRALLRESDAQRQGKPEV